MKKFFGYLFISIFVGVGLWAFYRNLKDDALFFILSMLAIFGLGGLFLFGIYLLKSK